MAEELKKARDAHFMDKCAWQKDRVQVITSNDTIKNLKKQQQEEKNCLRAEHRKKISSMEATLSQAWTDQQEMKTELPAEHKKEASKLQEELAKAKQDLVSQKSQWDSDSSNMKVTLKQAEQELEKQQQEWRQERTINTSRQTLEEVDKQRAESSDRQMERLSNVEGQLAGAQGKKTNIFKKWFRVFS